MSYIYQYIDDLLRFQSKAVEQYNHKGVLGDAREQFIHSEISRRIDSIAERLHKGEVFFDTKEFGQHDIILRRKDSINPTLGGVVRISSEDCAAIIEVKTNAKLVEIKKFDIKAKELKQINPNIVCGMFCYKISGKTKTVLARSGYKFDKEYQAFEEDCSKKEYSSIDFILCLDDELETNGIDHFKNQIIYSKGFFLKRNTVTYELYQSPPYSKMLFQELQRADQLNI
ncbi:DUF6602 domain-containing protein [Vibrio splendidus]|uniref:DUF6602 domain-containing protein n=1 Tax=Vibrio TaxID=662 RepID=UPI000C82132F|nr:MULTISPECIES: DUF6602 domain-containing protein [Vibrio]PMG64333.1 hypothetical protein BCU87_07535 [Vibrio lentus]PMG65688.1 hypothetical protein BCU86_01275 [Vibrio lentus]PMM99731.1 hypothetical protein BCT40_09160 [Vibrio lentus]PMP37029.1 hypothetical protein BCS86_22950 [Vibrio splendidus]